MHDDLVEGLEQTWSGLHELLASVTGDEWERPTPCEEWTVKDLAAHIGGVEGRFQGFAQPEPPEEWTYPKEGINFFTAQGVAARRDWSVDEVLDEVKRASEAQLSRLRSLDDAGWDEKTMGPLGETTMAGLAQIRLVDLYTHLLDLRMGLGRPLEPEREPTAGALVVGRAIELTPWAAVKRADLPDGAAVCLDLSGPGGRTVDVVVEGGRGRLRDSESGVADRIEGPALAYTMVAEGRASMADAAGGVTARGEAASTLLERYRLFQ